MNHDISHRTLFDAAVETYDRYRPTYPAEAIECVLSLAGLKDDARLLEAGAGTGQATARFAERGYAIDCLEPGARLARQARRNLAGWPNVKVIEERFEDFTGPSESYDLVYAAQAFHWLEPAVRFTKASTLLSRSGSLALLYNYTPAAETDFEKALHRAIDAASDSSMKTGNYEESVAFWSNEIKASELFFNLQVERFRWQTQYTPEEYAGLIGTYSSFLALAPDVQKRVREGVKKVFSAHGPLFTRSYICVVFHARKNRRRSAD
jgi:SAM-dependent methyltransferase